MKLCRKKLAGKGGAWLLLAFALTGLAVPAAAQKKDKTTIKQTPDAGMGGDGKAPVALPDSQAVDRSIGEALGYWQIGDVDSLHKYYSDDVVVVSGDWTPPVIGWNNYVKAYQAARAQVEGGRLERTNTIIKVDGNFAWATYQFDYMTMVQNKAAEFRGHTTMILKRAGDHWLIVLNHSSVVDSAFGNTGPASGAQPGQP